MTDSSRDELMQRSCVTSSLLGAPGIATRSKEAILVAPGLTTRSKDRRRAEGPRPRLARPVVTSRSDEKRAERSGAQGSQPRKRRSKTDGLWSGEKIPCVTFLFVWNVSGTYDHL